MIDLFLFWIWIGGIPIAYKLGSGGRIARGLDAFVWPTSVGAALAHMAVFGEAMARLTALNRQRAREESAK